MKSETKLDESAVRRRVEHDINAPLCNIRAFTEELRYVGEAIQEIQKKHAQVFPEDVQKELAALVESDINVCTDALLQSTDDLQEKIGQLVNTLYGKS